MKTAYDIILRPVITEKSMQSAAEKKYVFYVAPESCKVEIAKAAEQIFGVKVKSVNTINLKGKEKRVGVHKGYTKDRKKAIITLTEDSKSIEIFENMN